MCTYSIVCMTLLSILQCFAPLVDTDELTTSQIIHAIEIVLSIHWVNTRLDD